MHTMIPPFVSLHLPASDIAAAIKPSSSCCQPSFHKEKNVTPGNTLLCWCLHTSVSSLGPFFLSPLHPKVKIPSLWGSRSPNERFVHTDPSPAFLQHWFFYKMNLFLLRSHPNKICDGKLVFFFFLFTTFS